MAERWRSREPETHTQTDWQTNRQRYRAEATQIQRDGDMYEQEMFFATHTQHIRTATCLYILSCAYACKYRYSDSTVDGRKFDGKN